MATIVGRNCKVEVALTFESLISPTAVSKAYPPSVTLTSHGLTDGAIGYWSITDSGMVELDEQAVYVDQTDSNAFTLPGLDSTNYGTYAAGSFYEVATWGVVSEAASYSVGGGEANALDDPRLMDAKLRQIAGFLQPENLTIDVSPQEVDGSAMQFIIRKARNGEKVLVKISKGSRVLRVAYGTPSVPNESVQAGQKASGTFNLIVPAFVLKPNHA